jgi:hypothetical protein
VRSFESCRRTLQYCIAYFNLSLHLRLGALCYLWPKRGRISLQRRLNGRVALAHVLDVVAATLTVAAVAVLPGREAFAIELQTA